MDAVVGRGRVEERFVVALPHGDQLVDGRTVMLLEQRVEQRHPLLHLLQAPGRQVHAAVQRIDLGQDVVHLDPGRFQTGLQFRQGRQEIRDALQLAGRLLEGGHHAGRLPFRLQQRQGALQRFLDLFGVGQAALLLLQGFEFARDELRLVQLAPLGLVVVAVGLQAREPLPLRGEPGAQVLQRAPGLPAGGEPCAVAGEMVQHGKLEMGIGEQQALVLRMDVHQALGHLLQQADLHRAVVDEAARTSRPGHHAADQQRAAVRLDIRLGQQGVQGFVLAGELRLDHAGISSLLDQRRVRLGP